MRRMRLFLTLLLLLAPAMARADEGTSIKEGFKEAHEGMKKVVTSVGKKAKKDMKVIDKKAKKDLKTVDKTAKKTWKKAGNDVKKAADD